MNRWLIAVGFQPSTQATATARVGVHGPGGHRVHQRREAAGRAPGETITEGLDGLRERLAEYRELGACFAKWQGMFSMNALGNALWELSFSYGRALQAPPLSIWADQEANLAAAQAAYAHRARCNGEARFGRYSAQVELGLTPA